MYKMSRGLFARSLYKLPISLSSVSWQHHQEISVQPLYKSSVGKISVREHLAKSLYKISLRALCTRSLQLRGLCGKIPVQTLYKTPLCQGFCTRSPWLSKCTPNRHNESDKVPRALREGSQNSHRAQDSWASDLKMSTEPPQREAQSAGLRDRSPSHRFVRDFRQNGRWRSFCAVVRRVIKNGAHVWDHLESTPTVRTPSVATLVGGQNKTNTWRPLHASTLSTNLPPCDSLCNAYH